MKKWISKLFLILAAVCMISPVFRTTASAASYQTVLAHRDTDTSERKVGKTTFLVEYENDTYTLYATYKGSKHVLAVSKFMNYTIVTNGSTVFYGTNDYSNGKCQIWRVKSNGDGATLLKTFRSAAGFQLAGYYNKTIYYTTYKDWDYGTLRTYNINSRKPGTFKKNCGNATQYGKYLYLSPNTGAVAPLKFQVYNAQTKKTKTITKKMVSYKVTGEKLYYAEYIKCDPVYGKNTLKIYRSSLSGSGKKTLIKSLKARYITKFGKKSVTYTDYNNVKKTKKY